MAAKTRKDSIYVVYEGYREGYFLEHLALYSNVRLNPQHCNGGSANQIVINGIKHSARDVKVYVFFDEDFESKPEYIILDETFEGLENAWKISTSLKGCKYRNLRSLNKDLRNPILIVSYPQSIEGFLLRLMGTPLQDLDGKTTQHLKDMIAGFLGNIPLSNEDTEKTKGYDEKIAKYTQELQQSEPQNRKRLQYLEAKIREFKRNRNKVKFMRFLNEKLPLSALAARRADIPELDLLLTAFGL